jgi:hypothetical protein
MLGNFSPESLRAFAEALNLNTGNQDFSEGVFDFKVCEKPDGKHYGIPDDIKCAPPNKEVKSRPSGFLGIGAGNQMNWDTAAAQGATKTAELNKKKDAVIKELKGLQSQMDNIPGSSLVHDLTNAYMERSRLSDLARYGVKGTKNDIEKLERDKQVIAKAASTLPKNDVKKAFDLDGKIWDARQKWPVPGTNPPGFGDNPSETFKKWKHLSDQGDAVYKAAKAKGMSKEKADAAAKAAVLRAVKGKLPSESSTAAPTPKKPTTTASEPLKSKAKPASPPKKYNYTPDEARAQYKTWWNLSKINNNMNDFSTDTGIVEKMEKDGFPVDVIKNDPSFRKKVATCYKTTGNSWNCG